MFTRKPRANRLARATLTRLFLASMAMTATTAWAVVTGIVIEPNAITIGDGGTAKANDLGNQDPIESYKWELKRIFPSGWSTFWTTVGSESALDFTTSFPTTNRLRLTVTYKKVGPEDPPAPTEHTKDIVVAPADSVAVDAGTMTKAANPGGIDLEYQVKSGGNNCGGYLAGTAQKRMIDRTDEEGNPLEDFPGWFPITPSPTFRLIAGKIFDEHGVNLPANKWNAVPIGGSLGSMTQLLRIHWTDSGGFVYENSLGSVKIVHRKVSDTEWQIEAAVQP